MSGHWTSQKSQPSVPTLDQVPKLLEVLGVDADDVPEEIRRLLYELNGRKGQPGENWAKREVIKERTMVQGGGNALQLREGERREVEANITTPATEAAKQWEGWGTALKPANEPIVLARKPFKGTVAENVQEHSTGALNIDGCRVGGKEGRWPANVLLDEEAGALLDEQSGHIKSGKPSGKRNGSDHNVAYADIAKGSDLTGYGDQGGASRFFYCAKTSKKERNAGISEEASNNHPTVKPISLMRYLCRLITSPGGTVLDPFLGSGTTGCAALLEGFNFIGIEMDDEYVKIARARIKHWEQEAQDSAESS